MALKRGNTPAAARQARPSTAAVPATAHLRTPASPPTPTSAATPAAAAAVALSADAVEAGLRRIAEAAAACQRCPLYQGRKQVVPGQGRIYQPDIMFVGEAPGAEEDEQGLAFVGRAGQLLTKMISAMGYTREEVFIGNICKCRPPNNRQPAAEEMAACIPFLKEQIALIQPRVIVAMGNTAILGLLGINGISQLRGKWREFEGIPLMPTYHPAYLLRFPTVKRETWEDLKMVLHKLGRPVPAPEKSQKA